MKNDELFLKYQAARELGLMEKLERVGWAGLSAKETGRVGGLVRSMKRTQRKDT